MNAFHSRAFGQPMRCRHDWGGKEFVDGFGLCSPGRWPPSQRGSHCSWEELQHAEALRVQRNFVIQELGDVRTASFRLAAGQIGKSPFRPEAMARLRQEMSSFMEDPGLSLQIPERQPFC